MTSFKTKIQCFIYYSIILEKLHLIFKNKLKSSLFVEIKIVIFLGLHKYYILHFYTVVNT